VILVVPTAPAGAIAIAVLLTPWPRLPAIFATMPAFGGLLVIALLRHAEGGAVILAKRALRDLAPSA
jgi:peptidoglycan/LPS O-acetylase OafA/YrhL